MQIHVCKSLYISFEIIMIKEREREKKILALAHSS